MRGSSVFSVARLLGFLSLPDLSILSVRELLCSLYVRLLGSPSTETSLFSLLRELLGSLLSVIFYLPEKYLGEKREERNEGTESHPEPLRQSPRGAQVIQ
jgi:hypothetical protein